MLFVVVVSFSVSAQNSNEIILNKEVLTLDEICESQTFLTSRNPEYLRDISVKLLTTKHRNNLKFQAFGNYALAEADYYNQDFEKSLLGYQKALSYFKTINDTLRIASTLNSIGVVNFILSNDAEATQAYLEGFKYYEAKANKLGMGQMLQNVALIYWRSGEYAKSDKYGLQAIGIYKEIGEKGYLADMYNNYAVSLVKRLRYSEGLKYYQLATNIYKELENKRGETSVLFNIGVLFEYQNQMDSAYTYYKQAHTYFTLSHDTLNLVNSFIKLANYLQYKKEYDSALQLLNQSNNLNDKIGDKEARMLANQSLSTCYEALGDYQNAFYYYKLYKQFNDSLSKTATQAKIAEVESAFQVKQAQKALALSIQSNRSQSVLILFIIIGTFVSFIAIYFYIRIYRFEQEKRSLLLEHKVLRTQMDPHFIFNSMSALQCYIMDDKPDDAIRFLTDFSALLRLVLQYSKDELIPIIKEKKILEYYLSLQNKRFDNKIGFEIEIDQALVNLNATIPPMLAQPFIENSLEHGGLAQFEDAKIWVSFKKVENRILLTIIDNGVGVENAQFHFKDNEHKSMAMAITHERLALLNTNQREKVDFSIKDLSHEGGRGTKVEFSIPLNR